MGELILLVNLLASAYMAGVIWVVQGVHYPLFARVGDTGFCGYHQSHTSRITWVVGPAMLVEAGCALGLLVWARPDAMPLWAAAAGVGLVGVNWLSTALVQVPCHNRLARGFDGATHRVLVVTNALRAAAWSAHALMLGWVVWRVMGSFGG